jgi:hypothetical protein
MARPSYSRSDVVGRLVARRSDERREHTTELVRLREAYARVSAELATARERIAELTTLASAERDRQRGMRELAARLEDDEAVELLRQHRWIRAGAAWDADAGDYAIPDGWPDGETAELAVARELGVTVREVAPVVRPPDASPGTSPDNPFVRVERKRKVAGR